MTSIISLANEKGGVAKTTTAISLGSALAEAGSKVLMVDLDAQANLSLALGIEESSSRPNTAGILLSGVLAQSAVVETSIPRLAVIPSSRELNLAERFLPSRQAYEKILQKIFHETRWKFDFILFDCPPFLGVVTYLALMASDLLLIPTQAEYFSISALRNMMSLVRRIRSHGNPQLTYRLLLTMLDQRNRIHRSMAEQLRSKFGAGVLNSIIEIDTKLRECPIAGLPILLHSPKSRSALQYRALAQEILLYVKEPIE